MMSNEFSDDDYMIWFGTDYKYIHSIPHIISPDKHRLFLSVKSFAHGDIGLVGHLPLVDAAGQPYLGNITDHIHDFSLWGLELNQRAIDTYGPHPKAGGFSFATSLSVDRDGLEQLMRQLRLYEYSYYDCIRYTICNLNLIRWAYIPLIEEMPYASFFSIDASDIRHVQKLCILGENWAGSPR